MYGASATVWNVGERCCADAQGVGRLLWGVEALSLSLSLSLARSLAFLFLSCLIAFFLIFYSPLFSFLIVSISLPPLFFQYLLADRLYALCHIRACSLIYALLVICMGD